MVITQKDAQVPIKISRRDAEKTNPVIPQCENGTFSDLPCYKGTLISSLIVIPAHAGMTN